MANEYLVNSDDLTAVASAIREKGGTEEPLVFPDGFISAVQGIQSGGGGSITTATLKDINFYDYDGTLLYSYTLEEAQSLTALPDGPVHDGLAFDGWNYSLESVKSLTRPVNIGAMYSTDDGTTRIYIHLEEGRTSPMLGVCPNGTVTVDWGDGTTPDILTGTSVTKVKWTPAHNYVSSGDYVIKLTVEGKAQLYGSTSSNEYAYILRYGSASDSRNRLYQNSILKVEIGAGIHIGPNAFYNCSSMSSITIPDGVTNIGDSAFCNCYSLSSVTIPDGVTNIRSNAFRTCYSLSSITIPDGVTSIENSAFYNCYSLSSVTILGGVTSIKPNTFYNCNSLSSITILDGVTSIEDSAFRNCYSLSSVTIPGGVTSIGPNAFRYCYGMRYYDFTSFQAVPTLSNTNVFTNISADCEIRVPSALVDEWKAATNWATYADHIVGV